MASISEQRRLPAGLPVLECVQVLEHGSGFMPDPALFALGMEMPHQRRLVWAAAYVAVARHAGTAVRTAAGLPLTAAWYHIRQIKAGGKPETMGAQVSRFSQ